MSLTVTDLFAGFGGASSGLADVPGLEVVMAANHWQLAVDVHNDNHPNADHACVDLHLEDPAYFPKTDILWASPECTQWSQANGKKPDLAPLLGGWSLFDDLDDDLKMDEDAATRSRLLMFDVLRFIEHHHYRYVIVENVVDIARNPKYRAAWEAWQRGLINLGYQFQVISLNSMHAQALGTPAPQSRDRLYVVANRNDMPVPDVAAFMRPRAWCSRCDGVVESFQAWKPGRSVGKYRQQYVYLCATPGCGTTVEPGWLPAAAAIDWSIQGRRIGDRDKPLADKTRARIAAGIARYWHPFHIEAGGNQYDAADPKHPQHGDPNAYMRAWPVEDYLRTLHTAESKALLVPLEGRDGKRAQTAADAFRTQTTRHDLALACPPFLTQFRERVRDLDPARSPLPTVVADGANHALVAPFIAELRGGGSDARSVESPLSTVTASGNHHALLAPYYGATQAAQSVDEPVGTLTTVDRYALVMRNNSAKGGNPARHTTPANEYLRTLTANGPIPSLIQRHNTGGAGMLTPASEYLRTLTTKGHQSLITPGDLAIAEAQVDDCLFRMLEPHEVAAGMAFPADYLWDGTRRERVRLAGNAVTPPAARDLGAVLVDALGGAA